ncbi:Ubiquitin-conjugating enzyme E2 G2 [Dissostichus eleginoides]|uniref:Ubiquitin-conjugating enzyme E2 G2 n=1 Tax=Dissostichus eleginoides TaxID=100907 RepID=A0AAD9FKU5_DISEL|nr:Ubiquitin-conjugating enzyme E2 G2 [Dissostichus eleginoides]
MPPVPKHRWLMQVYAQDVLQRLDEIKATITSQYGRILKMDSTKKVARKLAGKSYGTATWATNVGNEHGQVIMSVLTASEGYGLGPMVEGLINRYRMAGVAPPEVLYVDRDCCGNTLLRRMFEEWNNMTIRLDIWHFMRRFAVGCSTDSHQLYASFMSRLSHCIFMWDQDDLKAAKDAKRAELEAGGRHPCEADVLRSVSRSELALHCRRVTRGTKETQAQIHRLIQTFDGDAGRDSLGVPLINSAWMSEIIKSQWKHVACVQDPPGVQLYAQTGSSVKGGHRLPTYRCARGSTSLESFHLHLNRFIPGTLASDTFFQAYLLDGLARWNEDRAVAATRDEQQHPHCYNHLLRHAVNTLAEEVLGKKIIPYVGPRKYTEELMGVPLPANWSSSSGLQAGHTRVREQRAPCPPCQWSLLHQHPVLPVSGPSSTSTLSSLSVVPPPPAPCPPCQWSILHQHPVLPVSGPSSTSTLSSLSVVHPPPAPCPPCQWSILHQHPVLPVSGPSSTSTLSSLSVVPPPSSTSTLSSLSVVPPPSSTSTLSSLSVVPPPSSTSTLSSLSVVPPSSSTSTLSSLSVVPPSSSTSTLSSLSVVPPSSSTSTLSSLPDCVGPDNIEGYGAVQELAEFLFGLREHLLAFSGDECAKRITLWQALGNFDKRKTSYPPRHKNTLKQGRFRATKKIAAPGVESTKRCFIWAHSPAQWPYCNRVVEAIFTRLCGLYKNTVRCEGRGSHGSAALQVSGTAVLKQGIPAPDAPMAGPEQLLVAMQKGTSLFPGSLAEPHTFVLPPNTAGEAKLQKRSQPVAISQVPPPPPYHALPFLAPTPPFSTPYMVPSVQLPQVPGPSQVVPGSSQMMLLNMPLASATQALTSSQSNVPYTTQQYRERKEEREQSGSGKRKGPQDTCFEGGVFPAVLSFPSDYPLSPPKMRFTCDMFHPNKPNDESGANVDASKMWREDRQQFYSLAQNIVRKSLGL